jgi:hypothetical protein
MTTAYVEAEASLSVNALINHAKYYYGKMILWKHLQTKK